MLLLNWGSTVHRLNKVIPRNNVVLPSITDDGAVRIWKDFSTKSTELNLVTAWQAISDLSTASKYCKYSPVGRVVSFNRHVIRAFENKIHTI